MKLDEKVKEYEADDIICIGAESAFIFIGTRRQYEEDIESLNKEHVDREKKLFADECRAVRFMMSHGIPGQRRLKDGGIEHLAWNKAVAFFFANLTASERRRDFHKKYVQTFIPFQQREVKETFKRFDDENVILIEGCENGLYWLKGEYAERGNTDEWSNGLV